MLVEDLNKLRYNGYKVILAVNSTDRCKKLHKDLFDLDLEVAISKSRNIELKSSQIVIVPANLSKGFEQVITDSEIIGVNKKVSKKSKKKKNKNGQKIESFLDLKIGDYVVHENSGIGRYTGIEQILVNGVKKDYLK